MAGRQRMVIGDINITPLTDIFLVMLIIMMVLAPSMANNPGNLEAPDIRTGNVVNEQAVKVTITKEGTMQVQGVPADPGQLADLLRDAAAAANTKNVSINADKSIENGQIFLILEAAQEAGLEQAAIIGAQQQESP